MTPNKRHVEILAEAYEVTPEYVMRNLHIYQAELTALATLQRECDKDYNDLLEKASIKALNDEATIASLREQIEEQHMAGSKLIEEIASLKEELETERMRHAACGVIAMSNTRESLAKNSEMKPEYLSASVQEVIKAVNREIIHREEVERLKNQADKEYKGYKFGKDENY